MTLQFIEITWFIISTNTQSRLSLINVIIIVVLDEGRTPNLFLYIVFLKVGFFPDINDYLYHFRETNFFLLVSVKKILQLYLFCNLALNNQV